jgi:hypothetical protein
MNPRSISGTIKSGSIAACLLISGMLAGCAGGSSALPQSAISPSSTQQQQALQSALTVQPDVYKSWRESLAATGLPSSGCFESTYPAHAWTRIACSTPPNLLYPATATQMVRARAMMATQSVGNGDDHTIDTSGNNMSEAVGSFPVVTGVTSVKSVTNPEFGCCGENGKNSYTLQLNSYFFTSSACNGQANCAGWEQFVYENPPSGEGQLFIQDWLVPTGSNSVKCPSGKGWESADGGCVQNSPNGVDIPNVSITKLASLVETGEAATSGDSIYLSVGSTEYGMKNVQSDGITDLASNWQGAEFNVIGNAGGDIADFNSGSTVEVQLEGNDGLSSAPTCPADSGTTGESNNLSFKAAPSGTDDTYPSIVFEMSNVSGGGSGSCNALPAN